MIIFDIIWGIIKIYFLLFVFGGAVIGFAIALGILICITQFGWGLLRDWWKKWREAHKAPEIEKVKGNDPRPGCECMVNVDDYQYKSKGD
jgi:UPF0716 family protein affecting phage T7 exclusion